MSGLEVETNGEKVRGTLSSLVFWLVPAYFVLAIVVIWLYAVTGANRRDEALRKGERVADARNRVNQCIQGRPQAAKIDRFIYVVLRFHIAAWENAKTAADATPPTDPQYAVRKANVERYRVTIGPVAAISFPIPTVKECLALGKTRYGVVTPSVPITKVKVPKPPTVPDEALAPGRKL